MKKLFLILICMISFAANAQFSNRYEFVTDFSLTKVGRTINADASNILLTVDVDVASKEILLSISSPYSETNKYKMFIDAPVKTASWVTGVKGDKYKCYAVDGGGNDVSFGTSEEVDVYFFDNYQVCIIFSHQTQTGFYFSNYFPSESQIIK